MVCCLRTWFAIVEGKHEFYCMLSPSVNDVKAWSKANSLRKVHKNTTQCTVLIWKNYPYWFFMGVLPVFWIYALDWLKEMSVNLYYMAFFKCRKICIWLKIIKIEVILWWGCASILSEQLMSEDLPINVTGTAVMQRRMGNESSTSLISNYTKCQSVSAIGIKDQTLTLNKSSRTK